MKVYLVTAGSYSNYHICGAFSTREKAEAALTLFDEASIEEFELNRYKPHPEGWRPWTVWFNHNGTSEAWQTDIEYLHPLGVAEHHRDDQHTSHEVTLWARDEEHAVKIASEHRARWIAEAPLREAAKKPG